MPKCCLSSTTNHLSAFTALEAWTTRLQDKASTSLVCASTWTFKIKAEGIRFETSQPLVARSRISGSLKIAASCEQNRFSHLVRSRRVIKPLGNSLSLLW